METALVLILLGTAIVLFTAEKISVDIITLAMLAVLIFARVLTPQEAFAGFSTEMIVILGSIFVISGAVQGSGILENVVARILRFGSGGPRRLTFLIMGLAGSVSAFMNNTTVTAMLAAPVAGIGRRSGVGASRLLMPLAFASILGGTCTLIGTSTNVAVSGYIAQAGMKPLALFELLPIGLVILGVGTAYMVLLGPRLLPSRGDTPVTPPAAMREYLSEILLLPGSPLIGQRAVDWELLLIDCRILKVIRGDDSILPSSEVILEEGDVLLVEGKVENLMKVQTIEGIEIRARATVEAAEIQGADVRIEEVVLLPNCELVGKTLVEVDFRQRYGLLALAVNHLGSSIVDELGEITLGVGDVLLVQGREDRVAALPESGIHRLGTYKPPSTGGWRGWFVLLVFLAAIVLGSSGIVPLAGAFLGAAVAAVLSGSISADKARTIIDWRLLILIGGMTAFGTAMDKSGAADLLASWVVAACSQFGIMGVLAGFFVLTIILTQPMSNASAALVVLPVALSAAATLGANERTFAIAVMLAASISFITPFEPASLIVYSQGKYRFADFVRVGGGLTVLLVVVTLILLPWFWPLR